MKREKSYRRYEFYYLGQWRTIPQISKLTGISSGCLRYRLLTAKYSLETAVCEYIRVYPEDWSP